MCLEIWIARNKKLFETTPTPSPEHLRKRAFFLSAEFNSSANQKSPTPPPNLSLYNPSIIPPQWVVISVDASFVGCVEHASIGGWLRDSRKDWVMKFQKNVYASDMLMAELLSIVEGLSLAEHEFYDFVTILSDNSNY